MAIDSVGSGADGKDSKSARSLKSSVLPGFENDSHLASTLLAVLKTHADELATDHLELLQKQVAATRAKSAPTPQELRQLVRRLMAIEVAVFAECA